jgi:hypothetical protein
MDKYLSSQFKSNTLTKYMKKMKVASKSLKDICEKIQIKKFNLLNVNVERYGAVFQSNDWKDQKCRP